MSNKVEVSGDGSSHKVNVGDRSVTFSPVLKIGSTVVIIGVVLVLVFNFGFNSPSNKIVGTWRTSSNYTYVFDKGGKYQSDGGYMGTYKIDGDYLIISVILLDNEIYKFDLSGDSLKLYNEDGSLYVSLTRLK